MISLVNDYNDLSGGSHNTRTFSDIFPEEEVFLTEYQNSALYDSFFTEDSQRKLYYLLYSRYGNSHILSSDENRFKYQLFSIIFAKGNIWQKKLQIQNTLLNFTTADILDGGHSIENYAENPSVVNDLPNDTDDGVDFINNQTYVKNKKDEVSAYQSYLYSLKDVSSSFLNEFKKLFIKVVSPNIPTETFYNEEV